MSPDAYIGTTAALLMIGAMGVFFCWMVEEEHQFERWSIGMFLKRLFQGCLVMPLVGLLVWSIKLIILLVVE